MRNIASQFLPQLSCEEKLGLLGDLKAAIAEELALPSSSPKQCPPCGCPDFVKKGRGRSGEQRWLCKGCA